MNSRRDFMQAIAGGFLLALQQFVPGAQPEPKTEPWAYRVRLICENYPGITPIDCEDFTLDQILILTCDLN